MLVTNAHLSQVRIISTKHFDIQILKYIFLTKYSQKFEQINIGAGELTTLGNHSPLNDGQETELPLGDKKKN